MKVEIKKLRTQKHKELCARWQVTNDPWKTLGATYERCLEGFSDRNKFCFIIRFENKPIGFLILIKQGVLRGYIATVFIAPEYQGRGFGSQVIAFAEHELFKEFPNVFLCVSAFNKKAEKLYHRLGYSRVGVLKDFFVSGYDEIILRKSRGTISSFRER